MLSSSFQHLIYSVETFFTFVNRRQYLSSRWQQNINHSNCLQFDYYDYCFDIPVFISESALIIWMYSYWILCSWKFRKALYFTLLVYWEECGVSLSWNICGRRGILQMDCVNYILKGEIFTGRNVRDHNKSKTTTKGSADKRSIIATFAVSLGGNLLPMQLIYDGKTEFTSI